MNGAGSKAGYHYGLIYQGQLVQCISICKSRFSKLAPLEILRSASAPGITVIGGLSRLITHAVTDLQSPLITYADRCWGDGQSYAKAGAQYVGTTPPGFKWWRHYEVISRFESWGNSINKRVDKYDPNISRDENMRLAGWRKIWDAGNNIFLIPSKT